MVKIEIHRIVYTDKSVISKIVVTSDKTKKSFSGYALENAHAGVLHNKKPSPPGTYSATIRTDGRLGWRLELSHVPGHTSIEIHHGNFPRNSEGCFVPGKTKGADFVGHSDAAMREIRLIVEADGTNNIVVRITGANK